MTLLLKLKQPPGALPAHTALEYLRTSAVFSMPAALGGIAVLLLSKAGPPCPALPPQGYCYCRLSLPLGQDCPSFRLCWIRLSRSSWAASPTILRTQHCPACHVLFPLSILHSPVHVKTSQESSVPSMSMAPCASELF